MKPKRFSIGQEITLKKRRCWFNLLDHPKPGPRFGEIVRVTGHIYFENEWFVSVAGHDGAFEEMAFAPVISADVLKNELKKIEQTVEL